MKGKIFTTDEANRMLPLVSRIADDIVATYATVTAALAALDNAKKRAEADEDCVLEVRHCDEVVGNLLDAFQALVEEIEALGGTVKDYERGLIDFYGEVDGEIVYLCWQRGEPAIAFWHELDEGFAKRRALPAPVNAA